MKTVVIFGWCISILFLISIGFTITNRNLANPILNYFFWLSLGLFVGYNLCFREMKKAIRENNNANEGSGSN